MRALVTGANRGIGLEIVRQLVQDGWEVVAACRHRSPELESLGVRIETVDVADDASVAELGERLRGVELDLLVNNAGLLHSDGLEPLELEKIRRQVEVNALGPLKVSAALLGNLRDGGKLAIITSRMGSMADNTSGGHYGYRMSKAAVNAAGVSLAQDLRDRRITVLLIHPGYVKTELTGGKGLLEPPESAAGILRIIEKSDLEDTGSFIHVDGSRLPW